MSFDSGSSDFDNSSNQPSQTGSDMNDLFFNKRRPKGKENIWVTLIIVIATITSFIGIGSYIFSQNDDVSSSSTITQTSIPIP